jgi:uncharacterized BrkB/YihY/UPF0761 family membrane protein
MKAYGIALAVVAYCVGSVPFGMYMFEFTNSPKAGIIGAFVMLFAFFLAQQFRIFEIMERIAKLERETQELRSK